MAQKVAFFAPRHAVGSLGQVLGGASTQPVPAQATICCAGPIIQWSLHKTAHLF
jgi:hypothetical protein